MKSIAVIATVICVTSIICSLVNLLAPKGNTRRMLNTVLGAFILCSMLLPVKNLMTNFKVNMPVTQPQSELTASADEAYNKAVIAETKKNLESALSDYFKRKNIDINDVSVSLYLYDNGGIYIKEINIYINENQKENISVIITLTKKKFDIKPHVYVR